MSVEEADGGRSFELGLVMAGAISAGAYTAGVVDFLIEALDAWEAAKRRGDPGVPPHDVRLKVVTGASAGAMTAAVAAVSLNGEIDPVHDVDAPPGRERNRLYDSWVRRVGIAAMLGEEDLSDGMVRSVLDASDLDRIANEALDVPRSETARGWVDDPLAVFLTVANLRGVPYGFRLFGTDGAARYGMTAHQDHMRFSVSPSGAVLPGGRLLDPAEAPEGNWPQLVRAALASGAFPIGLRSRALERPFDDYAERLARPPLWGEATADSYRFLCVDGGLIDNEPLELARRYLARGGQNPRGGNEAHRAVVMVDPFPNVAALAEDNSERDGILGVAGAMFGALVAQARFKPEELELAEDDANYSRFVISPTRSDEAGRRVEPAMASATLGGFGGFLSEAFRRHDFQLGRRNCQRFLQGHFSLPETNPLFAGWPDPARRRDWYVRWADGTMDSVSEDDSTPMLPIIPLVGSARTEVPRYPAPSASAVDLDALERMILARAKAVGGAMVEGELRDVIGSGVVRWSVRKFLNWRIAPKVAAKARGKIAEDLARLR